MWKNQWNLNHKFIDKCDICLNWKLLREENDNLFFSYSPQSLSSLCEMMESKKDYIITIISKLKSNIKKEKI